MMFCTGAVLAEVPVKDIPADHPAYKAVQGLIEKGYLGLYQDGTFQGGHAVDRYTLATVIGKVLTDIQNGRLVLPAEEMKTLRQLATEFRAELVELAGRVNAQGQAQEKLSADVTILREDGTRMLGEMYTMQGRLDKVSGDLSQLVADDNGIRQTVSSLEGRTQENAQAIAALSARTDNLEKLTAGQVADLARNKGLESSYAELRTEFDSYRRSSEAEVEQLKTTNKWLIGGLAALGLIAVTR
jgi:chromosome segregation ATPase